MTNLTSRRVVKAAILTAVVLVLLPAASLSYAQRHEPPGNRLRAVQGLVVVDANGKTVGKVLGFERSLKAASSAYSGPVVALDVDGYLFPLVVFEDRFFGTIDPFFFKSDDCTGTPLLPETGSVLPSVAVGPPGHTVYIEDPNAMAETITVNPYSTMTVASSLYVPIWF